MKTENDTYLELIKYVNDGYSLDQLLFLRRGLIEGLDISFYCDQSFDSRQMEQIYLGLLSEVDVTLFANNKLSYRKMEQIRLSLEQGIDATFYNSNYYDSRTMYNFRVELNSEIIGTKAISRKKNTDEAEILDDALSIDDDSILDDTDTEDIVSYFEDSFMVDDDKLEDSFWYNDEHPSYISEDYWSDDLESLLSLSNFTFYLDPDDYYRESCTKYGVLTASEEKILFGRILNNNEEAFDVFFKKNMRLVYSIARKFNNLYENIELSDLIQVGLIGLNKAIDKFDLSLGYKFSTYATWWIKQSIHRFIADNNRIVRFPVHLGEKITQLMRNFGLKRHEFTIDTIDKSLLEISGVQINQEDKLEIIDILNIGEIVSFDNLLFENEIDDLLPNDYFVNSTQDDIEHFNNQNTIDNLLSKLTSRERDVIILRFGLNNSKPKTLEDIGLKMNVTRERIRQIEYKAIKKMRNNYKFEDKKKSP
jgi:RNA polymerase primary sigma factor